MDQVLDTRFRILSFSMTEERDQLAYFGVETFPETKIGRTLVAMSAYRTWRSNGVVSAVTPGILWKLRDKQGQVLDAHLVEYGRFSYERGAILGAERVSLKPT